MTNHAWSGQGSRSDKDAHSTRVAAKEAVLKGARVGGSASVGIGRLATPAQQGAISLFRVSAIGLVVGLTDAVPQSTVGSPLSWPALGGRSDTVSG